MGRTRVANLKQAHIGRLLEKSVAPDTDHQHPKSNFYQRTLRMVKDDQQRRGHVGAVGALAGRKFSARISRAMWDRVCDRVLRLNSVYEAAVRISTVGGITI